MKPPRVLLAGIFHETNTFARGISGLQDFALRTGSELLDGTDDGSPVAAFLRFAAERGWEVVPSFDLRLNPGPMVADEVVEFAVNRLCEDLAEAMRDGLDGVFLILHGAMVAQSCSDVEGLLLQRIAESLHGRNVPVAAALDLHANVSETMAANADILLSYRCNPHTDAADTAIHTAKLLDRLMRSGMRSEVQLVRAPLLWPPTGTGSADEPMKGLLKIAHDHEHLGIHAISVCPGFAHADTPCAGLTFPIVIDPHTVDSGALAAVSAALVNYAITHAQAGCPQEWKVRDAIADAMDRQEFPALLVEPADNIGGGAPGDGTWILDEVLRSGTELKIGIILNDPESVALLHKSDVGSICAVPLGGGNPDLSGPPVKLSWTVLAKSDGAFTVEDTKSHIVSMVGMRVEMGPSILLGHGELRVLVTTRKTPPFDLGQWRCMGVNPEEFQLIGIKAAVAHRQAYNKISKRSYTVSTPGPCTSDLSSLPYRQVHRPIFPLDPLDAVSAP